jgi:8-amino-7-oxononanoate synthase
MSTRNEFLLTIQEELEKIKEDGLYREIVDLKEGFINLSSNDYLGLSNHPEILSSFIEGAKKYGISSCSSRLVSGGRDVHRETEDKIASWKGKEGAILFQSGYHANTGVISALSPDEIFSDRLNHASIIDGCRLSKAILSIYEHCDPDSLEGLLKKSKSRKKLIVSESVFSMDGDMAPLKDIVFLKEKYGALLMVDEAHATGVFGRNGSGLCEDMGIQDGVDVSMGTFSKGAGCFGAYIAGDKIIIDLIVNRARSFIFSTAIPPPIVCAISKSIDIMKRDRWRAERVLGYGERIRKRMKEIGVDTGMSRTQIVPLIIGDERKTMEVASSLMKMGFFVRGIRYPSVPRGLARIRISPSASHSENEIEFFLSRFEEVWNEFGRKG